MRFLNEIKLAGLLHDIGKFYQKAGTGKTVAGVNVQGHHAMVSANFVEVYREIFENLGINVDAVKEIVQHHHTRKDKNYEISVDEAKAEFKVLCNVVNYADNISSSERLEETDITKGGYYATVPLTSIFSTLVPGKKYNYPLGTFVKTHDKASASHIKNDTNTNQVYIESFAEELNKINNDADDFDKYFNKLNTLLEKYLWCIPSDSQQRLADVSLYDHLKTTSAIATIMYDELVNNPEYRKGLRSDKASLGWEFTDASVSKVDSFSLIKVGIKNPEKFIISNHDNSVSSLEFIERNKKFIANRFSKLEKDILKCGTPLSPVNIVISQTYSRYILVNSTNIPKVVETLNKHNATLGIQTGLEVYFEMSTVKIPKRDMGTQNVHKYINELDKVFKHSGYCETTLDTKYHGIENILTSGNHWNSSAEVFSEVENTEIGVVAGIPELSEQAKWNIREFIKNTSDKTLCIVRLSIDNLDKAMDELFKISNKTLEAFTEEYMKKQVLAETLGVIEDDTDTTSEKFEYATISRVATATRMIIEAMKLRYPNSVIITNSQYQTEFITSANDIFNIVNSFKSRINRMTLGGLTFTAYIVSFKPSDELEYVYNGLVNECETHNKSTDTIWFNGKPMKWLDLAEANKLMKQVENSIQLNKSNIFKLREFISGYYEYTENKNTAKLLGIARFFNNKEKNFTDKTIDKDLIAFVTKQFEEINHGKEPSYMLAILLGIINNAISINRKQEG